MSNQCNHCPFKDLTPKAIFLLEKILKDARGIKSQYLKQIFAANHLHQLQLTGSSADMAILPTEIGHEKLYLVYALLEELALAS
jgi:hypothetical protein